VGLRSWPRLREWGALKRDSSRPCRAPVGRPSWRRCFLRDAVEASADGGRVRGRSGLAPIETQGSSRMRLPLRADPHRVRYLGISSTRLDRGHSGDGPPGGSGLCGTDSPTLPREIADDAVSLVMALTWTWSSARRDGGYYLI